MTGSIMSMWVVYDRPLDFPTSFVARLHEVTSQGSRPTAHIITSRSLDVLRGKLAGRGFACLTRMPADDPKIVETWL